MPNDNRLSFEIINGKFPLIDLTIKSLNGDTIISLEKNYISSEISTDIKPKRRPGKFQLVLTNQALSLIPSWIKRQHMLHDTDFFATQEHTLFDIEVVEPGLVKINGIWMYKDTALVISPNGMSVIRRGNEAPITFKGEGSKSILRYRGPISLPLFGLFP